jgi:hypothetical protein
LLNITKKTGTYFFSLPNLLITALNIHSPKYLYFRLYIQQPHTPAILTETQELTINNKCLLDFLSTNTTTLQQCIDILEILDFKFIVTKTTTTIENELKAQENIAKTQERYTHYTNLKRQDITIHERDLVLLSTKELDLQQFTSCDKRVITLKYISSYPVLQKITLITAKLRLLGHMTMLSTFHISQLIPYNDWSERIPPTTDHIHGLSQTPIVEILG